MNKIITGFSLLLSMYSYAGIQYSCEVGVGESYNDSDSFKSVIKNIIVETDGKLASAGSTFISIKSDLPMAVEVDDPKMQVRLTISDLMAGISDPPKPGTIRDEDQYKPTTMLNAYTVASVDQKTIIAGFRYDLNNFIEVVCTKL